jgi:hypothetical protein
LKLGIWNFSGALVAPKSDEGGWVLDAWSFGFFMDVQTDIVDASLQAMFRTPSLRLGLAVLLVAVVGCSRSMTHEEMQAKLNKVMARMVAQYGNSQDRENLKAAKLFHNLNGLDMEIVGLAVPISSGSNKVFVAFPAEHFRRAAVSALATEGLQDLRNARQQGNGGGNG